MEQDEAETDAAKSAVQPKKSEKKKKAGPRMLGERGHRHDQLAQHNVQGNNIPLAQSPANAYPGFSQGSFQVSSMPVAQGQLGAPMQRNNAPPVQSRAGADPGFSQGSFQVSFGPGVPHSLPVTSDSSQLTPNFVASPPAGAQMGSFKAQRFGPVLPQRFNAASASSQANAVQRGPRVFKSCQARVNLWDFLLIDNSYVERRELLGRGAYAEVYEGQVRGLTCAIKLYRSTASQKQLDEAKREIMLMASLEHPCTLRLIGWVKRPLQTITELCLGDLKDFYKDKIEGLLYSEFRALVLLRVGFCSPSRVNLAWQSILLLHRFFD